VTHAWTGQYNARAIYEVYVNSTTAERWDDIGTLDVRELVRRLWMGRIWIAASVLVFLGLAAAIAFLSTPVYRATTVLIPSGVDQANLGGSLGGALSQLGGLASLAGLNIGGNTGSTEEALAVLRSRQFTQNFISDLGLMPQLFAKNWDAAAGRWKTAEGKQPTLGRAVRYFDQSIRTVTQDKKTGLVTLQVDWTDRTKVALWANELVKRLNEEMRQRAIRNSDASVGFLQKEMAATAVIETRQAIGRLIEYQINQRMLANVTQEYAFRVVDPAVLPDPNDVVWPPRAILLAGGLVVGLGFGCVAAFLMTGGTARR
jgi:uncharacterized protein involved in exopolysaccharide biosynthesis